MARTQHKEDIGDWTYEHIGGNAIKIYPKNSTHSMKLLGITTDVISEINIPYYHRINKIVMWQTNSAYAASDDNFNISVKRAAGTVKPQSKFEEPLYIEETISTDDFFERFGEGFEYEPSIWRLTLNGTNNNLMFPIIYIQKLGKQEN